MVNLGTPYIHGSFLCNEARWGGAVTSTGLGHYHYDGGFKWYEEPISLNTWLPFCIRFGGIIGAHKIQIDINRVDGTPHDFTTDPAILASATKAGFHAFNATTVYDFDIADRVTLKAAVADSVRDNYLNSYIATTYGV